MPTTENGSVWPQCRPEPYGYNHNLAAWHGYQYRRSTFRPFGIPTPVKHRRYKLLDIEDAEAKTESRDDVIISGGQNEVVRLHKGTALRTDA